MVNDSKKQDPRFWRRWEEAGAIKEKQKRIWRCDNCRKQRHNFVVLLNAGYGIDGLGAYELPGHPPVDAQKAFCEDSCLVEFVQTQPEQALVFVSCKQTMPSTGEDYALGCARCGKHEGRLISIKGEWGSVLDDINRPTYFCSAQCIIDEVRLLSKEKGRYIRGE